MVKRNTQWPPRRVPAQFPFTAARDGWVRFYKGKTRFVCGRSTPISDVEDRWAEKKRVIDRGETEPVKPDSITIRLLASMFVQRQRRRVETGRPEPLSPFTLRDYIVTLRKFAACVGPDLPVGELAPDKFNRFAQLFDKSAASTLARNIAYVQAMFAWGKGAGHCEVPHYGPDFFKPGSSAIRSERLEKVKRYTPDEIAALWRSGDFMEKLWIGLGINAAMDNSDLSNLTWDVIDLAGGTIDYRRRKTGKVRRVIPLHPRLLRMLKAWRRHVKGEYVFETDAGHRLVRMKGNTSIDFISMRWTRLLQKAGIRAKPKRVTGEDGVRRYTFAKHAGDHRGFRGLRTTFSNLVPPGFGDERRIVMGHSHGDTFLDNYLETVGIDRLRVMVTAVWDAAFTGLGKRGQRRKPLAGGGAAAA